MKKGVHQQKGVEKRQHGVRELELKANPGLMPVQALGKSNGSPRVQGKSKEEEGRQPQASPSSQQIPLFHWGPTASGR